MKSTKKNGAVAFAVALGAIALAIATVGVVVHPQQPGRDPSAKQPAGPNPSRIYEGKQRAMPPLEASGKDPRAAVLEFIDFAGTSGGDRHEEIRKALAGASQNRDVANVLCEEAFRAQKQDHSRALLVLSLLGEMRNEAGAQCLGRFLELPFPKTGTKVDGEIIEQTALGELQAKAVDGLAYFNTKGTDELVLRAARAHPSIIVRAEAIEAYLWNHRDQQAEARRTLTQYVRKGEEIYLDRVRRDTGEGAESFNAKLEQFLKAHPEAIPPKPQYGEKQREKPKEKEQQTVKPPNW
jgi:hypothetical protein